jgi:starch-binding outer membrane protein, SusD/RagB family
MTRDRRFSWRRSPAGPLLGAALLILALVACDSMLDVELPGETTSDAIDDPSFASLMVLSAQGDFECAYSNFVFNTGNLSGELLGAVGTLLWIPLVTRNVLSHHEAYGQANCNGPTGLYSPLSIARFMADNALERLESYSEAEVPNRTELMGRAALYAGYSYAAFGEAFCEAAFDLGPALTPPQIFELAEDRFTTAIQMADAASDAATLNAAYVGRARVRLPLGKMAEAAADARMVPAGFEFHVTRSNAHARRQNSIYMQNGRGTSMTVDPNYWTTTWEGVPDPRIPVTDANRTAANGRTPLWVQQKYTSEADPIRLASHVEAQLVVAEVEGGQVAVDIINALHAAAGIPGFSSTDPEEIRAQVIEERRREFFLEGHRMGDLRRVGGFSDWNRAGTVNEWTLFEFGGTECFPLPDVERRNNPNIP